MSKAIIDFSAKKVIDVPVPQGHDQLCHFTQRITKFTRQTEVRDLDLTAIGQEQVRCLQIPMQLVEERASCRSDSAPAENNFSILTIQLLWQ